MQSCISVSVADFITVRFQRGLIPRRPSRANVSVAEFITVRFQRREPHLDHLRIVVSVAEFITVRFQPVHSADSNRTQGFSS